MLWLRRNNNFNQLYKCDISDELISPGEFYYKDDTDGLIVKATVYKEIQNAKKEEEWDYSKLNNAENEREYRQLLKEATAQIMRVTLLDRKVAGKYDPNYTESDELKSVYEAKNRGDI